MRSSISRAAFALLTATLCLAPAVAPAQGAQRVFVVIADSVPMSVPAASAALAGALTRQGWTVLADHAVGTDQSRCSFSAHVVVAQRPSHASALLALGTPAAYAIPVRFGVFEDERGVHVAMVNPLSVERTIVAESGLEASGRALVEEVSGVVAASTVPSASPAIVD